MDPADHRAHRMRGEDLHRSARDISTKLFEIRDGEHAEHLDGFLADVFDFAMQATGYVSSARYYEFSIHTEYQDALRKLSEHLSSQR